MKTVPIDYLASTLSYNSDSGVLFWEKRKGESKVILRFNSLYAGKPAGGVVGNGYLMIPLKINGIRKMFYAHRLAWALHYKSFPFSPLDHINGIRTDNRITNLREVNDNQNAANSIFSSFDNKRGVTLKKTGKWVAQMSHNNKNLYLGVYDTEAEAHAAFRGAATVLRGEFAQLSHRRQ